MFYDIMVIIYLVVVMCVLWGMTTGSKRVIGWYVRFQQWMMKKMHALFIK